MSIPAPLAGLAEVKSTVATDPSGRLLSSSPEHDGANDEAAAVAVSVNGFSVAGGAAKLGPLTTVLVKGGASSSVTGVRADAIVRVSVDPATTTQQVERVLREWAGGGAAGPPKPRPTPPRPISAPAAAPAPVRPAAPRPQPVADPSVDPWVALRRTLGRGLLNEAVALQRLLPAAGDPERAGSEPVAADAAERAMRVLLEGIGSVLAGDGVGGGRALEPLTAAGQPNLTFRWLALLWSARAGLRSGAVQAARAHVQEALTTARQLDIEARALSQWIAAEVLAHDGDSARALAWLGESRSRFEKIGDRWGVGQTWLSEARVLTSAKRETEASEAARHAADLLPDSDEPQVALARLAVMRDDLAGAETILGPLRTQAAERVRALATAIRAGHISVADAGEFLREQEAPPSERALRALERIAKGSPKLLLVREALAWMLLRIGRYDDAGHLFRGLLSQPLSPGDRASVMLGLSCIANAQGGPANPAAPLRAVVAAASTPARPTSEELPPLPPLSASALLARAPQNGSAGGGAVFSGQLSSFALPDLLEFLRSGKRTGLLVCSSASGMGALRFRDGWITGAASPSTPGVGEVLVRAKKLQADALRALAGALGPDVADQAVGERIVADGLADAAAVKWAFGRQIGHAIRELMQWTDGEFTFSREAEEAPESPALAVSLDPQGLLLNYFKEMDEAQREASSA